MATEGYRETNEASNPESFFLILRFVLSCHETRDYALLKNLAVRVTDLPLFTIVMRVYTYHGVYTLIIVIARTIL